MSETRWTPGPWRVFTPDDYEGPKSLPGLGVESEDGTAVIWYADRPETGIQHDRDAHLIAAAPELYEALEALITIPNAPLPFEFADSPEMRAAVAALRKARGEPAQPQEGE